MSLQPPVSSEDKNVGMEETEFGVWAANQGSGIGFHSQKRGYGMGGLQYSCRQFAGSSFSNLASRTVKSLMSAA